jgi:putative ABC transport system permease protein
MIKLIRLVTIRSIAVRRSRTLLSAFGIILGVASLFAIQSTNEAAYASITRLFQGTSGRVNLEIHASDMVSSFSENALTQITGARGVDLAAPIVKLQAALLDADEGQPLELSFFGASSGGILLHGILPEVDTRVRDYTVTSGRFLTSANDDFEIVLVETLAEDEDITVGDRIVLQTTQGPERLKVVGLIAMDGPGQQNQGNFGVVSLSTAQKMKAEKGEIDQIDIIAESDPANPDSLAQIRNQLQERMGSEFSVNFPASQGERMAQMLSGYQIGLNFMGAIALFVGAFLIYNAFSMTVVERTREFGLLRCIGMTRRQIIGQVLVEGLVLGIFSSVAGGILGIVLSRGFVSIMAQILGQPLNAGEISWKILTGSILMGLMVTLIAATLPALRAGQISPLEALQVRSKKQTGWIVRNGWWFGLMLLGFSVAVLIWNPFPFDVQFRMGSLVVFSLFIGAMLLVPLSTSLGERIVRRPFQWVYGSGGQLGTRNLERAQIRTMLTTASLLIGVSMIIVIQGMTASFSDDLFEWMDAYIGGDLYVNSSVPLKRDMQIRLETLPGVLAASPIRYFETTWLQPDGEEETINFMAVDPDSHMQVTSFVFADSNIDVQRMVSELNEGGSIFISSVLAEKYNIGAGDLLWLQTRKGPQSFRVAGVVMDFYNQGMVITGNWDDMRRYFRINDANTIFIKVKPGSSAEQVQSEIENLYGKRYQLSVESNQSVKSRALSLMSQAFSMFDVLGVLAVFVSAFGVVNTLTMSVYERTREIGMLRSIGMTGPQIVKMILAEAGLLGIIGAIMGLTFGILLTKIFLASMTAMSGYSLAFIIPPRSIILAIIVALVVSQIAAALPAGRASRTPILQAIHYE